MLNKESLEVISSNEDSINIVYERPTFYRRIFADFIDVLVFVLTFITAFIFVGMIIRSTPIYNKADNKVSTIREESTLFRWAPSRKTWENISTWLDNNNELVYGERVHLCSKTIESFHAYIAIKTDPSFDNSNTNFFTLMENNLYYFAPKNPSVPMEEREYYTNDDVFGEDFAYLIEKYNEARLSDKMRYTPKEMKGTPSYGLPMFVWKDETHKEIIHNPDILDNDGNAKYYYEKFYSPYALINCGGYLVKYIPEYYDAMKIMSNSLFYVQFPITILLAGFLTYLLPALIWKRSHFTLGKFSMQIGIVDSRYLSPSFGRYFARWSIFFFGEIALSLFTFGLPFIISFSMMALSKNRQGFPDYMLGLNEVDVNRQKIYFTKYEVAIDYAKNHKQPIDFEMRHTEHL